MGQWQRRFVQLQARRGKSAAQIFDEQGQDAGPAGPRWKIRQGGTLTKTGAAAWKMAAYTQMRIRQHATACAGHGFDLARSETWTSQRGGLSRPVQGAPAAETALAGSTAQASVPDVAGRGRRAAGVPAFLQENVVLST